MKAIKILLIISAASVSSLATAEGGSDRIFDRALAANKAAMQTFKEERQQSVSSNEQAADNERGARAEN
tara:strand:+ start:459 stop:665 length:207 start_codon:yes stop_codon:yes gene_type:complete